MIKDTTLVTVINRNNGATGYEIPDQRINRTWQPGETKSIPYGELRSFSYMPGGLYALNNLFIINNKEALEALNMQVEPEYFYTEKEVKNVLFNGSYDEFADFLDFAPEGAIEIAKTIAVTEEIPDVKKREMLGEKTGLNISNAIMINKIMDEDDAEADNTKTKERRVKINADAKEDEKTTTTTRRTEVPQYKVVNNK